MQVKKFLFISGSADQAECTEKRNAGEHLSSLINTNFVLSAVISGY